VLSKIFSGGFNETGLVFLDVVRFTIYLVKVKKFVLGEKAKVNNNLEQREYY
jgi:hypothetical protein